MKNGKVRSNVLLDICQKVKIRGNILTEEKKEIELLFGNRTKKAWEALNDTRVKKYIFKPSNRVVWIVVGRQRDYIIMPKSGYCSCDDFYYSVMERKTFFCYHLIAQMLAESLNRYDTIHENDDLHDALMREWKEASP